MKFKTIYSVVWYTFIGCFWYLFLGCSFIWLICGLSYNFLYNDKVEQSRVELTQALNVAFPRERYIIDGAPYDSNRRNLLSIGRAIDIKQDLQHMDIKSIKPLSGDWELVEQNKNWFVYENQLYRVYVTKHTKNDGYTVVLARNNWLEILHL